jgi:outer membrane protein OmpA-like peptidoglycan-associated protein
MGTDPNNSDSDGDGQSDGSEKNSGSDPNNTNDKYVDSDGDGMSDDYESSKGFDPNDSSDATVDSDGDGIANADEVAMGTDPNNSDSDGDNSNSDSSNYDDNVGEIASDEKTSTDSSIISFSSGDIIYQFSTNISEIDDSDSKLNKLLNELSNSSTKLTLIGHADSTGEADYNNSLSLKRAMSVYNFLIRKGYPSSLLNYEGLGENQPIGDNNTVRGRQLNRRVELIINK